MERKNAENIPGKPLKGVPEGKTIERPLMNKMVFQMPEDSEVEV